MQAEDSYAQKDARTVYKGEVVYVYAYDLAYDMKDTPISHILGQATSQYSMGPNKRSPKQMMFYRPQTVTLAPDTLRIRGRDVQIARSVKVFSVGAVSIVLRVPFENLTLRELVDYHEPEIDQIALKNYINDLAIRISDELQPYCIRPNPQIDRDETYTVFCLHGLSDSVRTEQWLSDNKSLVAALLTEETSADDLSAQQIEESTSQFVSYYNNDMVVVDWDAAVVVAPPENLDDILHVMELANVQLLELGAYDRLLDASLERAYRDLAKRKYFGRKTVNKYLREIRIDMARLSDELINTTKFFGDWYLADIYKSVSLRFHLDEWDSVINDKLKTLDELYGLLQQDTINFWMVLLEATIVLLFVIDLILIFYMK
ncbi:MAG: hypothetical protein WDA68_11060 [Phycisphaerae bacterium]